MAVTSTQIARVRSLANVTAVEYDTAAVTAVIELYPIVDSSGYFPDEDDYTETYDLYRAAADIVEQEAAKVAKQYDVTADGATLSRSQIAEGLFTLAARLRARANVQLVPSVQETIVEDDDDDEQTP